MASVLDMLLGSNQSTGEQFINNFISGWNQPAPEIQMPQMSGLDGNAQLILAQGLLKAQKPSIAKRTVDSVFSGISYGLDQKNKKIMKETLNQLMDSGKLQPTVKIGADGKPSVTLDPVDEFSNYKKMIEGAKLNQDMLASENKVATESDVQKKLLQLNKVKENVDAIDRINKARADNKLPPISMGSAMPGQRQAARLRTEGESAYNRLADMINTQKGRKLIDKLGQIEDVPVYTAEQARAKGKVEKGAKILPDKKKEDNYSIDSLLSEATGEKSVVSENKVVVVDSKGNQYKLPKEQLEEALKQGYRLVK